MKLFLLPFSPQVDVAISLSTLGKDLRSRDLRSRVFLIPLTSCPEDQAFSLWVLSLTHPHTFSPTVAVIYSFFSFIHLLIFCYSLSFALSLIHCSHSFSHSLIYSLIHSHSITHCHSLPFSHSLYPGASCATYQVISS